jgi:hypothetical protein
MQPDQPHGPAAEAIEDLYNRITGDEDARVCKDIPESACDDQPIWSPICWARSPTRSPAPSW